MSEPIALKFADNRAWAQSVLSINYHTCEPRVTAEEIDHLAEMRRRAECYDELVEALKNTLAALREYTDGDETPAQESILSNAEAALSKAEPDMA